MALREDQVLRYSRQILLPEVGGVGQERLLGHAFRLVGAGAAQETAAAYLAAAGCALLAPERAVAPAEAGFLLGAEGVGQPLGAALRAGLSALNPDAVRPAPEGPAQAAGELGEAPACFGGTGPRVAVGVLGEGAGVAYAEGGGCGACFAHAAGALGAGLGGAASVVAGSVAALVAERLVLGLTRGVGLLALEADGGLAPREVPRCARCG